jgi:serine/threonine protein kinase
MNMIHFAGDCAVPVVGRVTKRGEHVGFIMNQEVALNTCQFSKNSIMEMMRDVVKELHGKEIIHGDIKLSNMLLCSDGKVRLCDFHGAFLLRHSNEAPPVYTISHMSPYRALHPKGPLTMEDDYFALGVTIWELFTGMRPFQGMKMGAIREVIRDGGVVNLDEIEDIDVRHAVEKLMSFMLAKFRAQEVDAVE